MPDSGRADVLRFAYTFRLPDGTQRRFDQRAAGFNRLMSMSRGIHPPVFRHAHATPHQSIIVAA